MNYVLSALILLAILLPGFVFRITYLSSDSLRASINTTFVNEVALSFIPALLLNVLGVWALNILNGELLNFTQLYLLVTGSGINEKDHVKLDFEALSSSFFDFVWYVVIVSTVAWAAALAFKWVIKRYFLDLKFGFLQYANEWDQLFSGRIMGRSVYRNIELVVVAVVVSLKERDVIYFGVLEDYFLSADKGLNKIVLRQALRSNFSKDKSVKTEEEVQGKDPASEYYKIPDEFLIIPNSEIKNINVQYVYKQQTRTVTAKSYPGPSTGDLDGDA